MDYYYEIEAVGGYSHTVYEFDIEKNTSEKKVLDQAIEEKTYTAWVGGRCGIVDDWGRPVEKKVKRITKYNEDGSSEIIYEKPSRKK